MSTCGLYVQWLIYAPLRMRSLLVCHMRHTSRFLHSAQSFRSLQINSLGFLRGFLKASSWSSHDFFMAIFKSFFKGSLQAYQTLRYHQASTFSLRGGVRDMLAQCNRLKLNPSMCASQASYLYISLGFNLLYIPTLRFIVTQDLYCALIY